jgi:hypothetical protein
MAEQGNDPIQSDYKVTIGDNGELKPNPKEGDANSEKEVDTDNTDNTEGAEGAEGDNNTEGEGSMAGDSDTGNSVDDKGEGSDTPPQKTKEELFNELLSDKFNMSAEELENVLKKKEKDTPELPEDVQKYMEFKKETNRGLKDYLKLQEDFSAMDDKTLIKEYYKATRQGLEESDVESLMDIKFGYNEGASELEIKQKTLELKEELYKAKTHFESQKEKYKLPLESSGDLPEEAKKAVEFYNNYMVEQQAQDKRQKDTRSVFSEKTEKFFSEDFKGFEFKLDEDKVVFKPKDVEQTKSAQSDLSNFISQHTDDNGNLIDAKKYHTALSMALNPEAYAKFFYEQGKAKAIGNVVSEGKNIDMNVRSNIDSSKGKAKVRVIETNSQYMSGLKIKKR